MDLVTSTTDGIEASNLRDVALVGLATAAMDRNIFVHYTVQLLRTKSGRYIPYDAALMGKATVIGVDSIRFVLGDVCTGGCRMLRLLPHFVIHSIS